MIWVPNDALRRELLKAYETIDRMKREDAEARQLLSQIEELLFCGVLTIGHYSARGQAEFLCRRIKQWGEEHLGRTHALFSR